MNDVVGAHDHTVVAATRVRARRWPLTMLSLAWDDLKVTTHADPTSTIARYLPALASDAIALLEHADVSRDAVRMWHAIVSVLVRTGHTSEASEMASQRVTNLMRLADSAATTWALAVAKIDAVSASSDVDSERRRDVTCDDDRSESQARSECTGVATGAPDQFVKRFRALVKDVEALRTRSYRSDSWTRRLQEDAVSLFDSEARALVMQTGNSSVVLEAMNEHFSSLPHDDPFSLAGAGLHSSKSEYNQSKARSANRRHR